MKKSSSIKNKIIVISIVTIAVLFAVLIATISTIVNKNLKELETNVALENTNRAVEAYNFVLKNYEKKIIDWGEWDDTYEFIEDLNEDYKESNLGFETLENLHVDHMLFFDLGGDLKHATSSSMQKDLTDTETKIYRDAIYSKLQGTKLTSGLVNTSSGAVMYTAHQILKSDGSGDKKGYLFFGRHIDSWLSDEISLILQINTHIKSEYSDLSRFTLLSDNAYYQNQIIDNKIQSIFAIPVVGKKGVVFEFTNDLDFLNIVTNNARYMLLFILLLSIVAVVVNFIVIKKFILDEVDVLRVDVSKSADNLDIDNISTISKTFEIYELRSDINTLINRAYTSRKELLSKVEELNRLNNLMVGREVKMKELKEVISNLKKKII